MRVVMLILEYAPIVGGAQRQLAALAPLLVERGVEVEVWTRDVPGRPREETVDGVRVVRLPSPGPKVSASAIFTIAALARLRRDPPDLIHAYSLFSPATIAMIARRALGIPAIVKVLRGGRGGDIQRLVAKPLSAPRLHGLRRWMDGIVAISEEIESELRGLGIPEQRVFAIPNGVDLDRFQPVTRASTATATEPRGGARPPRAVYCGRLVPEKRVDLLLEAWPVVRRRLPGAELSIFGAGPCEAALREQRSEGVRFEGATEDVPEVLQRADVFVLPSDTEGLSNALLEAMASGLPVVATRVGGAVELVEQERAGWIVPPGDVDALATALIKILENPDRARQMGAFARGLVERRYSLKATAERLVSLYRRLASAGARPDRVHVLGETAP
jgi:glycosyltransferase involved in cell wall biosynthesis